MAYWLARLPEAVGVGGFANILDTDASPSPNPRGALPLSWTLPPGFELRQLPKPRVVGTYLSHRPSPLGSWAATISLGIIAVASALYWRRPAGLGDVWSGSGEAVFDHLQLWRLLTGMLVHADLSHLLANALPLGLLAYLIAGLFGPAVYPTISVLLGALVNLLALASYPPQTRLVGASGLVYLMAAFWLTSFVLIERRFSVPNRLFRCAGFSLIFLVPSTIEPQVSYRAHAIGFVVGVLFGLVHFRVRRRTIRAAEVLTVDD